MKTWMHSIGLALVGGGTAVFAGEALGASAGADSTISTKVGTSISLTISEPDVLLSPVGGGTAHPGDMVVGSSSMTVVTNNRLGYTLSVKALSPTMTSDDPDDTTSIPVGDLKLKMSTQTWLEPSRSMTTTSQDINTRSASTNGQVENIDYKMVIPSVLGGTYSVQLEYTASANG